MSCWYDSGRTWTWGKEKLGWGNLIGGGYLLVLCMVIGVGIDINSMDDHYGAREMRG